VIQRVDGWVGLLIVNTNAKKNVKEKQCERVHHAVLVDLLGWQTP
jgi:hypothetical protein